MTSFDDIMNGVTRKRKEPQVSTPSLKKITGTERKIQNLTQATPISTPKSPETVIDLTEDHTFMDLTSDETSPEKIEITWSPEDKVNLIITTRKTGIVKWNELAQTVFKGQKTGQDCKKMYNIILNSKLKILGKSKNNINLIKKGYEIFKKANDPYELISIAFFDSINLGVQCRTLHEKKQIIRRYWSPEEDELLLDGVEEYGIDWKTISAENFNGGEERTSQQCKARFEYINLQNPDIIKSTFHKWTSNEDKILLQGVEAYGNDWKKISNDLFRETVTNVQCSIRYRRLSQKK